MTNLILLIIFTLLLITFRWWINKNFQAVILLLGGSKNTAIKLYSLIFLPGVMLHELAHFFTTAILAVPTGEISILPQSVEDDTNEKEVVLGSVQVGKVDFFRMSLVGAAPFIIGSIAIYSISHIFFTDIIQSAGMVDLLAWLSQNLQLFTRWQTWVWLYAVIAIANTMFMSKKDMKSWPLLLITGLVIAGLLYVVGQLTAAIDLLFPLANQVATALNTSLLFTLALDLIFIIILFSLRKLLEKLVKKRVVFK